MKFGFIFIYYRGVTLGDTPTSSMLRCGIKKCVETILKDLTEEDSYRRIYAKDCEYVNLSTVPFSGQDESDYVGVSVATALEIKRRYKDINVHTRLYSTSMLLDSVNELEQKYKHIKWREIETDNLYQKK